MTYSAKDLKDIADAMMKRSEHADRLARLEVAHIKKEYHRGQAAAFREVAEILATTKLERS